MDNKQSEFYSTGESKQLISIVLNNRNAWAFPYAYLAHVQFDASGKLWLLFTTRAVLIEGRNLDELYQFLHAGEVHTIREGAVNAEVKTAEKELFIAKISVLSVEEYEANS